MEEKMQKRCYDFEEGDGKNKHLLGGKGANLCEMTQIGLPVPPGFVISTEACREYYVNNKQLPEGLMKEVKQHMAALEQKTNKGFGDPETPLLVSVRSGSALSMPGMMDTVLNLGLNDETVKTMIRLTRNERFVFDSYRRLLQLFGKICMGISDSHFDEIFEKVKEEQRVVSDTELMADDLKHICNCFKDLIQEKTGLPFPQDVWTQLEIAIEAVFRSWMGKRAVDYRRQFKITSEMANGTAVNICTMVFGNMGNDSATGVGFTRNPGTGENRLYGDYLINAQGEDVVAGIRTPQPLQNMRQDMPLTYQELENLRQILEKHYREVQDFEFTIEQGKFYVLQTRNGKMNAWARVKTAVDMVDEGLITKKEAISRPKPEILEQFLHCRIDPSAQQIEPILMGVAASPGAAAGKIVFDADRAERLGKQGEKLILVRIETKPEDIHGFFAAQGILTSRGGKTSHAAVVARGMGKPCVAGSESLEINYELREALVGTHLLKEGDIITIDGSNGTVYTGTVPMLKPELSQDVFALLRWADEIARMETWANADTPQMAALARKHGARGIGLCRTERMFNDPERLPIMQELILAETPEEREAAIERLLPMQRSDFLEIFRVMNGLPVTIRLLDPPLHEFLPTAEELQTEIAHLKKLDQIVRDLEELPAILLLLEFYKHIPTSEQIWHQCADCQNQGLGTKLLQQKENTLRKVKALAEVNPMLGHRGVRIAISYPEIYEMQIRAIFEAIALGLKEGLDVRPEIMIPQVCTLQELLWVHRRVVDIHGKIQEGYNVKINYKFGTMIEVVRACMRAGRLAEIAEFFSFGTNDLSQATFSFSREDAENKFLPLYNEQKILLNNPFETLDIKGVGRLMEVAIEWGRKARPNLKIGICGEHGGDPSSIEFCHRAGLDYVSCSPFRIPIARLAAAQAAIREANNTN